MRTAQLGTSRIELLGIVPTPGHRLEGEFAIPAARLARRPLVPADLQAGLVVVSTLPNIEKHACLAQIVELEERSHALIPQLRIIHVSADHDMYWREVDRFHPNIQAAGYSLCCADPASRASFVPIRLPSAWRSCRPRTPSRSPTGFPVAIASSRARSGP